MIDLSEREREALGRLLDLVERSLDAGVAGGEAEARKLAAGLVYRDVEIGRKLLERARQEATLVLPPSFRAS